MIIDGVYNNKMKDATVHLTMKSYKIQRDCEGRKQMHPSNEQVLLL